MFWFLWKNLERSKCLIIIKTAINLNFSNIYEFYLVPKMANFEANFKWDTLVFFHSLIWSLSMINLGWFSLRCSVTQHVSFWKKSSNEKYFKKQTNLANRIAPTLDFFVSLYLMLINWFTTTNTVALTSFLLCSKKLLV